MARFILLAIGMEFQFRWTVAGLMMMRAMRRLMVRRITACRRCRQCHRHCSAGCSGIEDKEDQLTGRRGCQLTVTAAAAPAAEVQQ